MLIDAGALTKPIAGAEPSGLNLEDDATFHALEGLHRPPAPKPGEEPARFEPVWKDVAAKASELLRGTHDIRVLARLARAGLQIEGLPAFAAALATLDGYLTQFWDSVHPRVEKEAGGELARLNAVSAFSDIPSMLRGLREVTLFRSKAFGAVTYSMIEAGRANSPAGANGRAALTAAQLTAAQADADPADVARQLALLRGAREAVVRIDKTLTDRLKQDKLLNTVDFSKLLKLLGDFEKLLAGPDAKADAAPDAGSTEAKPNGAAPAGPPVAGVSRPGVIGSRQDVIAALDRCCDYFRQHEPSSPVPLLLQRAKRLVTMDFIGIVRDLLAAQGVTQVEAVVGKQTDGAKSADKSADKSGEADKKS